MAILIRFTTPTHKTHTHTPKQIRRHIQPLLGSTLEGDEGDDDDEEEGIPAAAPAAETAAAAAGSGVSAPGGPPPPAVMELPTIHSGAEAEADDDTAPPAVGATAVAAATGGGWLARAWGGFVYLFGDLLSWPFLLFGVRFWPDAVCLFGGGGGVVGQLLPTPQCNPYHHWRLRIRMCSSACSSSHTNPPPHLHQYQVSCLFFYLAFIPLESWGVVYLRDERGFNSGCASLCLSGHMCVQTSAFQVCFYMHTRTHVVCSYILQPLRPSIQSHARPGKPPSAPP